MNENDLELKVMNKITNNNLFEQIKNLIEQTKNSVAVAVNSSLTMMYWEIGNKINQDILKNKRAQYGKEIVATLSQQLTIQYGKGYSYSALTRMMKFAKNIDESRKTISEHIGNIFKEGELEKNSVVRNFRITKILKEYLINGYAINQKRLEQKGLKELNETIRYCDKPDSQYLGGLNG